MNEGGKVQCEREWGTIPVKSATFRAVMVARRVAFSCWVTTSGVLAGGGGGTISSTGLPPMKARYCSMVSFGGVDTGKSNIQREEKREEVNIFTK